MKLIWFGHSCFRVETGSSCILIDPFLKGNPTFEKSGVDWRDAVKGVTHVALTHGHADHIGDSVEICKANSATLIATYELALYLKAKGAEKIDPLNTGGTAYTPDFDLTLTHALHSSSTDVYLGNPNGIVLKTREAKTIYHMGDTDVFSDMALIEELHKPDVGIVPIGDRFTMGGRTAAFACKKFFHFTTIVPCHYGTFADLLDPNPDTFVAAMGGDSVVVPKVGQALGI